MCLLLAAIEVHARDGGPLVGRLNSAALGEVRDYSVRLPASYAVVADVARTLASGRSLGGFFYLSVGAKEGNGPGRGFETLRAVLAAGAAGAGLRWRAEVTPEAAHESNVRLATPSALRAYFAAAQLPRPGR